MGLGDKVLKELRARFKSAFFPRDASTEEHDQRLRVSEDAETDDENSAPATSTDRTAVMEEQERERFSRSVAEDGKSYLWPKLSEGVYDWHIDASTLLRAQATKPLYRGRRFAEHACDLCEYLEYVIKRAFWTVGARVVTVNIDEPLAPIAKAPLTYSSRYEKTVDLRGRWPLENPFDDNTNLQELAESLNMPEMDMNSVWAYGLAKMHLIEYVTGRLIDFKDMPEDRLLVVDGAVVRKHCVACCTAAPIRPDCPSPIHHFTTTCIHVDTRLVCGDTNDDMVFMDREVRYFNSRLAVHMGIHPFGTGYPPAEGELKAFSQIYATTQRLQRSWTACFPAGTGTDADAEEPRPQVSPPLPPRSMPVRKTLITSIDGDCIFIALMQWFMRVDKTTKRFVNQLYLQRKQSLGTEAYLPEIKRLIAEAKGLDPENDADMKKIRNKVVMCSQYINMNRLQSDIIQLLEPCRPLGSGAKFYPVETLCLMAALEGNDYVRKVPGLCLKYFLNAYLKAHREIGTLLSIVENENEVPVRLVRVHMPGFLRLLYHAYVEFRKSYAVEDDGDECIDLISSNEEALLDRVHTNVRGAARRYALMCSRAEERRAANSAKRESSAKRRKPGKDTKPSLFGHENGDSHLHDSTEGAAADEEDEDELNAGEEGSSPTKKRKRPTETVARLESAYVIAANAAYYLTYIANGANPYYVPPIGTETRKDTNCNRVLSVHGYAIKNASLPLSKTNVKIADEVCMDVEIMSCTPRRWRPNFEEQCAPEDARIYIERCMYIRPETMQAINKAQRR